MKRLSYKIFYFPAAVSVMLLLGACERTSLIERQTEPYSDSGENRVQAKFDRKFVKELWGYPNSGQIFFLVKSPLIKCEFGSEVFYIYAQLEDDNLSSISFSIPLESLYEGALVESPSIKVSYRGKPSAAYDGELNIRKWDDQEGILSGTFEFKFDKELSGGRIRTVDVTEGYFDVKLEKSAE